jgi:hypothetical protein
MATKRRPPPGISGIFDIFRRRGPEERPRSIFEAFRPPPTVEPRGLPPGLPAPPAERGLMPRPPALPVTAVPRARPPGFFSVFAPAPPAPAPAAPALPARPREEEQRALWEVLFAPPAEEALPSPVEAFRAAARQEFARGSAVRPPAWTLRWPPRSAVGPWQIPASGELAARLNEMLDLGRLFGEVVLQRSTPEIHSALRAGQMVTYPIDPVIFREPHVDVMQFFGVPPEVVDFYYGGAETPEQERAAFEAFWNQIVNPLLVTLTQAFEILKPPELPGHFLAMQDERTGAWWLNYVETPFLGPGLSWEGGR